jgi:hypothetical protein
MDYLDTRFIVSGSMLNIFEKFYSEVWIKIKYEQNRKKNIVK